MPKRIDGGIALLADSTRRRLIAAIALRPTVRPSKLALLLGLSRSAVSRHLRRLREANLIVPHASYVDGRWISYSVNPDRQGQILAWLAGTEVGLEVALGRGADGIGAHALDGDVRRDRDSSAGDDSPVIAANGNDRSSA
jgi:DNA-binding transcriptional ArsR family regulator